MSSRAWLLAFAWLLAVPAHGAASRARIVSSSQPDYSDESRRAQEHGDVTVRVVIAKDGKATDVSVAKSSGFARLDAAALAAVRTWAFAAATDDAGAPIESSLRFNVRFELDDSLPSPAFDATSKRRVEVEWQELVGFLTLVHRATDRCAPRLGGERDALRRYPLFFQEIAKEISARDAWLRQYFKDSPPAKVDHMLEEEQKSTGFFTAMVLDQLITPRKSGKAVCEKFMASVETGVNLFIERKTVEWDAPGMELARSFRPTGKYLRDLQPG